MKRERGRERGKGERERESEGEGERRRGRMREHLVIDLLYFVNKLKMLAVEHRLFNIYHLAYAKRKVITTPPPKKHEVQL